MNAAVYARVSTDLQAEKGYSLQTQIEACTQKAKEMGAVAIKTYVDDGYSGSYLERPALDKLRDALDAKLYDMVVIYDQDRLSRTLSHQLLLTEEIEKSGAQLVFVSSEYKRTPEGILSRHCRAYRLASLVATSAKTVHRTVFFRILRMLPPCSNPFLMISSKK